MNAMPANAKNIQLPPNDGSLDRALAELSTKLDTWSGAMQNIENTLRNKVECVTARREGVIQAETKSAPKPEARPKGESKPTLVDQPVSSRLESPLTSGTVTCEVASAATTSTAEDEALLASLDSETAGKIRILRRLSNNKSSVRELLERLRATANRPSPTAEEPKKKSFWRR